ncbi:amino acid ABC transporter permease [Falsarthrobacter nasiphocae]|uniref:Glutamate transport system permease protein n=1 Tax=Falsarthrobacter nasiphocae TaxID=189863 RepID=A0AAE4C4M0_9MICC|nr:amino acid ABC transporter permease [Falsarthrobacter nasiphocae]MDR6891486.1 glutamate transport system permease protein [Falsarthrobacter nasiphocae]
MSASVLFDEPGPKARARYRVWGAVTIVAVLALVAFVIWRFAATGQFSAQKWRLFGYEKVQLELLKAMGNTLKAFAFASVLSLAFGFVLALGRLSSHRWLSGFARGITELLRAVPLLVLIMLLYYGVASLSTENGRLFPWLSPFWSVVIGLTLYNGSVLAEVFRAGVESLPRGQREAGLAIGLTHMKTMNLILLPQAVRAMMPVIVAQLVVILKDTALGFIVTYEEILFLAKNYGSNILYGAPIIPVSIIASVMYIGMCIILSAVAYWLQRRMARRGKVAGGGISGAALRSARQ